MLLEINESAMELVVLNFQRAVLEKRLLSTSEMTTPNSTLKINSSHSYVVFSSYLDCCWNEGRSSTSEV